MNRDYVTWKWLTAILLAAVLNATVGHAQPDDPPPVASEPEVKEQDPAPRSRRQRLDEMVVVGGDATVLPGQVAREVVVVRGNATIDGDVDGDVVVILGKLKVTGEVRGNVVVVLGEAEINGEIGDDVALILTHANLGSKAEIGGDLLAVGTPPDMDPAARIHGEPEIISLGPIMRYLDWAKDYLFQGVFLLRPFPPRLGWVWVFAGIFLVFHLVVAAVFPGALRGCMDTLRDQPARSFLLGLLACVLVAPISLLLSFTMVATPLIWLAFFALCVFGRIAVYATAGSGLGRAGGIQVLEQPLPAMLAGSLLFYLAYMVPLLGYLVYWLVLPWGVGAALIRVFEALRRERRPIPTGGLAGGSGTPESGRYPGIVAAQGLSSGVPGPATHAIVTGGETPPLPGEGEAIIGEAPTTPYQPLSGYQLPGEGESTVGSAPLPPPPPPPPPPRSPIVPLVGVELAAAPRIGFWPRLGAALIDLLVIGFVNAMTFESFKSFWFLVGVYHLVMWTWKGTTLGGAVLGLRLIRLDGRPVDWQTSAVRVLGSLVSLLPLGLGFFWVAWDDQFQSWHDRIAGTTIVKADRRMALV